MKKCRMCTKRGGLSLVKQSCNGHLIAWKVCSTCEAYLRANHKVTN